MNRPSFCVWTTLALLAPLCAMGSDLSDGIARIARDARRDVRGRGVLTQMTAPRAPVKKLTVGLAADKDGTEAKTFSTPFDVNYKTTGDNWWKLQLKGDGYTRVSSPGVTTVGGVADLKLNLAHQLPNSFIGVAGVAIPSHGKVGSAKMTEHATLLYSRNIGSRWSLVSFVDIKHYEGSVVSTSRYRQSAYAEADYEIKKDHTILVNILRTRRGGAQSSTEIGAEFDFPFLSKSMGALSVARGISRGARHTGLELDVTIRF